MLKELVFRSAVIASCVFSAGLHAQTLLGSTVEFGVYYPSPTSPISQVVSTTVSDGVEFTGIGALNRPGWFVADADVDVSASSILFDYSGAGTTANGAFNGYVFNFENLGGYFITGIELDGATTFAPDRVSLSFEPNSVFISIPNTPFSPSSVLAVNLQIAPVPEPATASLMLAGGLLIAAAARRRSKVASSRFKRHTCPPQDAEQA